MAGDGRKNDGLIFRRDGAPGSVTVTNARGDSTRLPAADANAYQEMGDLVKQLATVATRMNSLQAVDDETRRLIRAMRVLALDLQMEIERRVG